MIDPIHATGACIVDRNNRVVGIGYNGFPRGCSDDCLPWANETTSTIDDQKNTKPTKKNWLHTKSPFVVHAEMNAILNKCAADVAGARLYCQRFPCNECAKVILQSRISEVIYLTTQDSDIDDDDDDDRIRASRILLTMAGVHLRKYTPIQTAIKLDFGKSEDKAVLSSIDNDEKKVNEESRTTIAAAMPCDEVMKFRSLLIQEADYDPLLHPSSKRQNHLSWDDYFLAMALLTAQRSKDPNTQVGACIVDSNKRIIGLGYNGFPSGCSDDDLPWARQAENPLHTKYLYVCHAEVNAILNKGSADVRGATLYVALFPCNECAKLICQAGISEVVYMNDQYHDTDSCRASRIMFRMAGIRLRKHVPALPSICLNITSNELVK